MSTQGNSNSSEKKKPVLYIRTYGCQMNTRDGEVIAGMLKQSGFGLVDSADAADVVIFVTCSVRQHAEDKVWSEIGRIIKQRAKGKGQRVKPIIGLVGCMAQNYKEAVFERSPDVDFVVGPQDIHKIPSSIKKLYALRSTLYATKIWETDGDVRPEEIYHTGFYQDKEHAYVVISEGCSNFCSYCVVPYVRGPLRHRNFEDILREIELAVGSGRGKVTLLGQNVCAYQGLACSVERIADSKELNAKAYNFIQLLKMVNNIKGLEEFGFITSHPKDTTVELFEVMRGLGKLKKHLHLPVQSGSDRILKLMNRGYAKKYYLELANNYRKIVKGGVLTTDIIVGFPGETEEDFKDTVGLVKQVEFNAAYIFKYSPRPNTEALKLEDDVSKEEKERRHRIILDLQREISKKRKV
ncbi:MAG: tRNA (N6-isopentenyl adenosine(37)-C2)-methylthiotransferase MiaB [Candidatus Omnitrophota bacterium]